MAKCLILDAVKSSGTYDPDKTMRYLDDEQLTTDEFYNIQDFLGWAHENGREFGHGNIDVLYKEWENL